MTDDQTHDHLSCDVASAQLGEYLDGTLSPGEQQAYAQHLASCAACAALERDLREIVSKARALPAPAMPRDLWPEIAARLETPVLSLPVASSSASRPHHPGFSWQRLSVAAALLVTLSAGVTWTIARGGSGNPAAPVQVAANAADGSPRVAPALPQDAAISRRLATTEPALPQQPSTTVATAAPSSQSGPVRSGTARSGTAAPAGLAAASPTLQLAANTGGFALDTLYGREIALLRTVAESQLDLLDSSTVSVVRRNLDIIDQAIRECRTALADDPNSGFLLDQLGLAYERKVDLLRRLALL